MQFLTPLFALAAAALAIPVLLHLVRHRTSRQLAFASLMFFRKIPRKEIRRRRLKHLFLLFLRCLGLLLLVAAFAQPVLTGVWVGPIDPISARSVVILLDYSLSMSRPAVWQRALELATEKIESLDTEDEGLLVRFGEQAEVLSRWQEDPAGLRTLVQQLTPSHQSTSYPETLRVAGEMLRQARTSRHQIYLITDLQRSGWPAASRREVPPHATLEIGDAGSSAKANLFINTVRWVREAFGATYSHPLAVGLSTSPPQALQGEAQLFMGGQLVDRRSFALDETGQGQATFDAPALQEGPNRGRILLEPSDSLPQDNQYFFVLERREPQTVLLLSDSRTPGRSLYLNSALTSGKNAPFRPLIQAPAQLQPLDAEETALVILDDLKRLPPVKRFQEYLAAGGSLVLATGKKMQHLSLSPEWKDLLPAEFSARHFVRSSGQLYTSLVEVDWSHPSLSIFPEEHRSALSNIQFFGYWKLIPKANSKVLARFHGRDPALIESGDGPGKILLFASSLDTSWNDFPLRSAYVPFWHGWVLYLLDWNPQPAAFEINHWLSRDSTSLHPQDPASWNVIDPRGKRLVGLEQEDSAGVTLNLPGYYEIRSNKATDWLAVNPKARESDLARLLPEELRASGEATASEPNPAQSYASLSQPQRSLWWFLLLLAGAVFAFESVVANRYADVRIWKERQGPGTAA